MAGAIWTENCRRCAWPTETQGMPTPRQPGKDLNIDDLLLIVVGAHLKAEQSDRPTAYLLRDQIGAWLQANVNGAGVRPPLVPLVCTDVWYLNDTSLSTCPTISIGAPGVNAYTAYLADKLPSTFVIDDQLIVQMDPEFGDLTAACWGSSHALTQQACSIFVERYMDSFLNAAASERA